MYRKRPVIAAILILVTSGTNRLCRAQFGGGYGRTGSSATQDEYGTLLSLAPPDEPTIRGASAVETEIVRRLEQPLGMPHGEITLAQFAAELSERQSIPIALDQRELENAGEGADSRLTTPIDRVSGRTILDLALHRLDLAWLIQNDVLLITSEEAAEERLSTRVYDVRDLVDVFQFNDGAREADFDSLISLLTSTVDPHLWDDVGGPGSVHVYQHANVFALIIAQTWHTHEGIERLFQGLRQLNAANATSSQHLARKSTATRHRSPARPTAQRQYIESPSWLRSVEHP